MGTVSGRASASDTAVASQMCEPRASTRTSTAASAPSFTAARRTVRRTWSVPARSVNRACSAPATRSVTSTPAVFGFPSPALRAAQVTVTS